MLRLGSNISFRAGSSSRWLRIRPDNALRRQTRFSGVKSLQSQSSLLIPRFASQCRLLSHNASEIWNENNTVISEQSEEDKFTYLFLNSALGTLSSSQIEESFQMIDNWFKTNSGYGLDSADRLLQRLIYEDAAAPAKLQRFRPLLLEWQTKLLERWFQFSETPLALARAEIILTRLIDWEHADVELLSSTTADEFVRLLGLWLSLPQQHAFRGSTRAAQLLLWWTEDTNSATSVNGNLLPLFHKALDQCIESENRALAQALVVRMGDLQKLEEWNGIEPKESAWKEVNELPLSAPQDEYHALSNFAPKLSGAVMPAEAAVLRRLLFSFLETANVNDAEQVEEFAQKYQPFSPELKEELYFAVTDFYARVRNVNKAMQWVQKIDPATCTNMPLLEQALESILRLWINATTPEAPWRAHEILQRLEAIHAAKTSSYSIVTEMWMASSEPSAKRKARQLMPRIVEAFPPGKHNSLLDPHTLHIMLKYPHEFKDAVSLIDQAVAFVQNCNLFPKRLLPETVETLLTALAERGFGSLAGRVVKHPAVKAILTTSMCENALLAAVNSPRPMHGGFLFDHLAATHIKILSFRCYTLAMRAVVDDLHQDAFQAIKDIIRRLADRMANGDLHVVPNEFANTIERVSHRLKKAKRPQEADEILQLVESLFIQSPPLDVNFFSIESYKHVIGAWLAENQCDKAEETMERVLGLCRSGVSTLMPTADTFRMFLTYHSRKQDGAEKVMEWFYKLLALYKETNDVACKPDVVPFNIVLRSLGDSNASREQAMEIFEIMLEIGVDPESRTCNILMKGLLKGFDPYRDVMNFIKRMNELGLKPDMSTQLIVLDACAMALPRDRESALNTATQFLGRVRQEGRPRLTHYFSYFAAVVRLVQQDDPRFEALIISGFKLFSADGFPEESRRRLQRILRTRQLSESLERRLSLHSTTRSDHTINSSQLPSEQPSRKEQAGVLNATCSSTALSVVQDATELLNFIRGFGFGESSTFDDEAANQESLVELVENTLEALAKRRMGAQAEILLRRATYHLSITTKMSEEALLARNASSTAGATFKLFDYLGLINAPMSFVCYQVTMRALSRSKKKEKFETIKGLLTELGNRVLSGDLNVTQADLETLVVELTSTYARYKNTQEAKDLAVVLIQILGNMRLVMSPSTFRELLVCLGQDPDIAAEFFDKRIQIYEETKNEKLKPSHIDFALILRLYAANPNETASRRMLYYLDMQLQMGLQPMPECFRFVMRVLIAKEANPSSMILSLARRMDSSALKAMAPHNVIRIVEACLHAEPEDAEDALSIALKVLTTAHETRNAPQRLYQCFFRLLDKVVSKDDPRHEQIFMRAFQMCWFDKHRMFLESQFKEKMSSSTWDHLTGASEEEQLDSARTELKVES